MKRKLLLSWMTLHLFATWMYGQNKISLAEVATGFSIPVGIAHAGDTRLFIVEKDGYIRIVDTTGQVQPVEFLDIDAKVNSASSERGLLGLAFHPTYADNGFFYVNYTNSGGHTVVSRFSRDASDPTIADPSSEMIVMTVNQPFPNHNGGHLAFGPDGYLYIGLGDGGNGGDPGDRAQNGQERLGKMLRIDVDGGTPFAIPPDNPFVTVDTILDEIWALGLRNPWRYSFDRLTGDLWIGDVGQDAWEEVDYQAASSTGGENYGWRCKEGFASFNPSGCPPDGVLTEPAYAYAHVGGACSGTITGGYVYRGTRNPTLYGKYVFVDYCTGIFTSLLRDDLGNVTSEALANLQNSQFTSFGEDASGELYVAAAGGTIYRIEEIVSGVHQITERPDAIRPNPVTSAFAIAVEEKQPFTFAVYNAWGKKMISGMTSAHQSINCATLADGVYFVEWSSVQETMHVAKLIVMK